MKRALVTGGSGEIGAAICCALAQSDMFVYVHANKNLLKAEQLVQTIIAKGGHAQAVKFDVTHYKECVASIEALLVDGPIQVLVNNAGIHDDAIMAGMLPEQWTSVIDVTLNGFYNVTQAMLMSMMRTRWGRVINISSVAGVMGNRGQVNYAAAKAGLHGATKSLAIEMGSRGITVNAVAPGIIQSDMTDDIFDKAAIKKMVPLQRPGTVEEVADLVNFLASDKAAYISGQIIGINGAMA